MYEKLQSDVVDDLYFEGGRNRRAFRKLLSAGGVPAALLARAVDLSAPTPDSAAAATDVWRDVLRAAFSDVASFEFAATDATAMGTLLAPLAAITSHPPLLRLLASMLLQEVVQANGAAVGSGTAVAFKPQKWAEGSVLAPLLGVTTYINPDHVRRNVGSKLLNGGLPAVLAEVPGYPRNRCAACRPWLTVHACFSVQKFHTAVYVRTHDCITGFTGTQ